MELILASVVGLMVWRPTTGSLVPGSGDGGLSQATDVDGDRTMPMEPATTSPSAGRDHGDGAERT
jgi:hypothetical protein